MIARRAQVAVGAPVLHKEEEEEEEAEAEEAEEEEEEEPIWEGSLRGSEEPPV